jgi:UDP-glucose 4-epimerase
MSKVPVLVTGGAGYIGSHAVLALRDAGWSVYVIDDLSTGTRHVVPDDVPFYEIQNFSEREKNFCCLFSPLQPNLLT